MSHEIDRAYYQRCAEREREKAAQASDICIRRTHERLAETYEYKVAKMLPRQQEQPDYEIKIPKS